MNKLYLSLFVPGAILFSTLSYANPITIPGGSFTREQPFTIDLKKASFEENQIYKLSCTLKSDEAALAMRYKIYGTGGHGIGDATLNGARLDRYPQGKLIVGKENIFELGYLSYFGEATFSLITDASDYFAEVTNCVAILTASNEE